MSGIPPSRPSTSFVPVRGKRRIEGDRPPQPLTSFVGRESDLATVVDLLRNPSIRLVTIMGTGGVGKTRLALRAAGAIADAFPDGVVVVPLASVRDATMLLPTVAQILNVPDASGLSLPDRLQAFLADRDLLLVLDNLEHLLDAVPDVALLLARCPQLTILCTCRMELNVSGEHLVPLAPLPTEEARALFVERVRTRVPHFTLTDDLAPVIDAICQRLDGLPLAIELAAARVPALPPPALLSRLERRLDLLTNGPRDAPTRLRDMRDAIDWSHDLLSESQQRLFRRLGVFIGGFTLEAAEAVAGDDTDVLEGIAALVAASLAIPTDGVAGEARYTMLETIREYALERLTASGEESETRARHASYFRNVAEDALPLLDGPEVRITFDRVDIELDNCRAAMAWSLETRSAEIGVRLAGALWRIWSFEPSGGGKPSMDRMAEGLAWIEDMLSMRDGLAVDALTEALVGAGGFAWLLRHDADHCQAMGEELLARARVENYAYGEYWGLLMLGALAQERDDLVTSKRCFEQILALAPAVRNPINHQAIALQVLGELEHEEGNAAAAVRHLVESLRLSQMTGNLWVISDTAEALGRALLAEGQPGPAAMQLRDALLIFAELRRVFDVHASLVDLALVALTIEQPALAARLLGVASTYPDHPDTADALARATTDVQARLSADAFAAELENGRHMAWDDVLTEVDALVESVTEPPTASPALPVTEHDLSPRQVEVLRLVAEGQSNRAIAETLSVSERTVENHIFHIYTKLGMNSRAAAAAWAVRNGLL